MRTILSCALMQVLRLCAARRECVLDMLDLDLLDGTNQEHS